MPRQDKTGPWGAGPGTGWGMGPCGAGMGWRRGWGRGMGRMTGGWFNRPRTIDDEKAALAEEEKYLEEELEVVRKERAGLKDQK